MTSNADVENCIRAHCPEIAKRGEAEISSMTNHIIAMRDNALEAAGYETDAVQLTEAAKVLKNGIERFETLPAQTKRQINFLIPLAHREKVEQLGSDEFFESLFSSSGPKQLNIPPNPTSPYQDEAVFDDRMEALNSLLAGLTKAQEEQQTKETKHQKRNLEGPAVVAACMKIWREELGGDVDNPKKVTEPIKSFRNHDKPPIADFVQDVFGALQVHMDVRSAFNSLQRMGGEKALILTLKR
jgi:hypothetical protein